MFLNFYTIWSWVELMIIIRHPSLRNVHYKQFIDRIEEGWCVFGESVSHGDIWLVVSFWELKVGVQSHSKIFMLNSSLSMFIGSLKGFPMISLMCFSQIPTENLRAHLESWHFNQTLSIFPNLINLSDKISAFILIQGGLTNALSRKPVNLLDR